MKISILAQALDSSRACLKGLKGSRLGFLMFRFSPLFLFTLLEYQLKQVQLQLVMFELEFKAQAL